MAEVFLCSSSSRARSRSGTRSPTSSWCEATVGRPADPPRGLPDRRQRRAQPRAVAAPGDAAGRLPVGRLLPGGRPLGGARPVRPPVLRRPARHVDPLRRLDRGRRPPRRPGRHAPRPDPGAGDDGGGDEAARARRHLLDHLRRAVTAGAHFATLDHLSGGRAAWNVVTSVNKGEAENFGSRATSPTTSATTRPTSSWRWLRPVGQLGRRRPACSTASAGSTPTRRASASSTTAAATSARAGRSTSPLAAGPPRDHPGRLVRARPGVRGPLGRGRVRDPARRGADAPLPRRPAGQGRAAGPRRRAAQGAGGRDALRGPEPRRGGGAAGARTSAGRPDGRPLDPLEPHRLRLLDPAGRPAGGRARGRRDAAACSRWCGR